MPGIIPYLLKLSAALAMAYVFYRLVLRPLTFYTWNRWYLLGYSFLSIWIPFIDISSFQATHDIDQLRIVKLIPSMNDYQAHTRALWTPAPAFHISYHQLILVFMVLGSLFFLLRLIIRFLSLRKIKTRAKRINLGGAEIYQVDENILPFSFGNSIYINRKLYSEAELKEIILHEYVHVKQQHSVDMVWSELLTIINWYNPFAWLIRHAVRQNLEFIADEKVLKSGVDKKSYQYHLLQVIGLSSYRIANSFNNSSLKKRITMMNKLKTTSVQLLKFLFVMPLLVLALIGFRSRAAKIAPVFEMRDTIPAAAVPAGVPDAQPLAPAPEAPIPPVPQPDAAPAPAIRSMHVDRSAKLATVILEGGKKEVYHLDRPKEKQQFEKKYGEVFENEKKAKQWQEDALLRQAEAMREIQLMNDKLKWEAEVNNQLMRKQLDEEMQKQKKLQVLNQHIADSVSGMVEKNKEVLQHQLDEEMQKQEILQALNQHMADSVRGIAEKINEEVLLNQNQKLSMAEKQQQLAELQIREAMGKLNDMGERTQLRLEKVELQKQEMIMKNQLKQIRERQIQLEKKLGALEKDKKKQ